MVEINKNVKDLIIDDPYKLKDMEKGVIRCIAALENNEKMTGCTVHFVNEFLDSGAIIKQQVVPILPGDTVESLTRAIQQAEHSLLPSVINAF